MHAKGAKNSLRYLREFYSEVSVEDSLSDESKLIMIDGRFTQRRKVNAREGRKKISLCAICGNLLCGLRETSLSK
jgi:hypothetical protein